MCTICAAAKHCSITDTYVRVVPIITDVSVCGQFRNGTWTLDMADGTRTRFQFCASFFGASQG